MTTVPTWAAILVSIGTPALTFAGLLIAQAITRRSVAALGIRSRREETMRKLRWSAELVVADDPATAKLGIALSGAHPASQTL